MLVTRIAMRIENVEQMRLIKNAVVNGEEFAVVKNFVNAVGDPLRIEDVGIGEFWAEADIVLKVEGDAEVVEQVEQVDLTLAVGNIGLNTDLLVLVA